MRLVIRNRALKRRRGELAAIGAEALTAARLSSVMRGKVVLVPVGRGGGEAGGQYSRMGVVCDARAGFAEDRGFFASYRLKRLPPFAILNLTPIQCWALTLVHEATHVKQAGTRRYSELEAERSVIKAQQALGWGRLIYM